MLSQADARVQNPDFDRPSLLLIDGLEAILQMGPEACDDLAFILSHGPKALVWPVVVYAVVISLMLFSALTRKGEK